MSIVDESGITPEPGDHPIPLPEIRALDWLDIWHHHHTKYPDLAAEQDTAAFAAALDYYSDSCDVPGAYLRALRTGTPDTCYRITIDGRDVYIVLAHPPGPVDPPRESESWAELCHAIATATGCDGIHPALPRELALAIWTDDNGHEITACRPGAPVGAIRRARSRIRRRLTALSPLPLAGVLAQPLTGSATLVGIALAPVIPPIHTTPPPAPVVREYAGEIDRPELPHIPGLRLTAATPTPLAPLTPERPDDAAAPDTSPRPTITPAAPTTAPTTPAASPTPGVSTRPTPTSSPAPETTSADPTPAPTQPDQPPTDDTTPTAQPSPSSSHTPRGHAYGHDRHRHKPHPSHRRR